MTLTLIDGNPPESAATLGTVRRTPTESARSSRPPRLAGRRFSLIPLTPEHHYTVFRLSLAEEVNFRWRYHGAMPTWEAFESGLNANVLVQFAVVSNQDPKSPVGLVTAYNANLQDGTVYLGAVGSRQLGGGVLEGFILMIGYLFDVWPLRKIYMETPEFNVSQFASAVEGGYLHEEGRLASHRYFSGRYWDHLIYAHYRDDYERLCTDIPALASPGSGEVADTGATPGSSPAEGTGHPARR